MKVLEKKEEDIEASYGYCQEKPGTTIENLQMKKTTTYRQITSRNILIMA